MFNKEIKIYLLKITDIVNVSGSVNTVSHRNFLISLIIYDGILEETEGGRVV